MSRTLEYILSLKDGITDKINKISGAADKTTSKMQKLEKQALDNQKAFDKAGRSADGLRAKISNSLSVIPGADFLANPYVLAATAMIATGGAAMKVDENMAKINTTAQLTKPKLEALEDKLMDIGLAGNANLSTVPESFEKILSQTGDVAQSTEILEAALKGSKAGFTDSQVVADALAQSLSLVGKENANAQQVLDTFFAAKRVGAGEFKDFAQYMPNLIASGKALGMTYQTTAGLFAYMTGKGFAAEKSATLLENAYTALGKSEIQKGLAGAGINVFDKKGMLRDAGEIFTEMQKKIGSMSDSKKSNFLESIGLRDAQAKSAFMALTADADKLKEALNDTKNASGETDKAFENAQNPMMKVQALWTKMQYVGLKLGNGIMYALNPALDGMNWLFDKGFKVASWWKEKLQEGQPVVLIITGLIGSLIAGYALLSTWQTIVAAKTVIWTGVQWALNAAMTANPVGLIIAGIVALIALIGYVIYKTDGWGKAWTTVVNNSKLMWNSFTSQVRYLWEGTVNSIMIGMNRIQSGWLEFKNFVGIGDENANSDLLSQLNEDTENRKQEILSAKSEMDKASAALNNGRKNAFDDLIWNKKGVKDIAGSIKGKLGIGGITQPTIPGVLDNSAIGSGDKKDKKNKGLNKTNEAIATGGTKHNYITINLRNLVENLNVSGKDFREAKEQMREQVEDALMRTLAMATTAGV